MIAAITVGAISTAALVALERTEHHTGRAITKTIASAAFVLTGVFAGAATRGRVGEALLVALVLSMVGDLCLLSREHRAFVAGLGAFLLAHVAFAAAFVALGPAPWAVGAAAAPFGLLAFAVWRWLAPHVGRLARPVVAYVVVITAMVCLAAGVVAADPSPMRIGVGVAAVTFFASDLCVARDRFIAPGFANRAVGLPLYYAAQFLFAVVVSRA